MGCFLKNSPWTTVAIAAVLVLPAVFVPRLEAATGRTSLSSAANLGLYVSTINRRLMVIGVTGTYANLGVRFGDQIVAVNGRRVAAEAAFLNRLTMAKRGSASVTLTIARNGRLRT
jgi:S1-C subfamily serine protease